MKLLTYNIGVRIDNTKEVGEFLREQNADIIALQEVARHLEKSVFPQYRSKAEIETILGDQLPHRFFGPHRISDAFTENGEMYRDFGGLIEQGVEILSKHHFINATSEHYHRSYEFRSDISNFETEDHARNIVITEIEVKGKILQLLTLHGIWTENKLGDQRTIDECMYILKAAQRKDLPTIIAGDFNLLSSTESMQILNKAFRNLSDEYKLVTTRPITEKFPSNRKHVCDYILVNDKIDVIDFKAIDTDISDHLPLVLEFEI